MIAKCRGDGKRFRASHVDISDPLWAGLARVSFLRSARAWLEVALPIIAGQDVDGLLLSRP